MNIKSAHAKEKEREEKMKSLRRELEAQLTEQLSQELQPEGFKSQIEKAEAGEVHDPAQAKRIIEALIFAASKPLTVSEIRKTLGDFSARDIETWISELQSAYQQEGRSFEILEIAGGWEIATQKQFAPWILKIELQKKAKQASHSALETLAILAYKQPMTRAEIEELRGVDVSGVLNTLLERAFIKIVGRKEVPGRPFLYATTQKFLEHFGLKSLEELPKIEEIKSRVENSVKREDLLGTSKMIDVPEESSVPGEGRDQEESVPGTPEPGTGVEASSGSDDEGKNAPAGESHGLEPTA